MDFSGTRDPGDAHLYLRIAAVLEEAIRSGELPARSPVPSETTLVQETGAARNTVRKAIGHLRDRGLVYTVPQLGTFVTPAGGPPATAGELPGYASWS
jgi:DNA-binding GntR family transcriptional regulator